MFPITDPRNAEILVSEEPRIVYVAGPMRGIPDNNFPAFNCAAHYLRRLGHTVINPAELDEADGISGYKTDRSDVLINATTLAEVMTRDITLLSGCNHICLLEGWQYSYGARAEAMFAAALSLRFMLFFDWPHPSHTTIKCRSVMKNMEIALRHFDEVYDD